MNNKKIPVSILGATGMVGQHFIQLLKNHSMFTIASLAASDRSSGQTYKGACNWVLDEEMPEFVKDMVINPIQPNIPGQIAFSALPSEIALEVEPEFARAGYYVLSNASAFRQDTDVPLIIPEINPTHLGLLDRQQTKNKWKGLIVTSPNCTTTGIAMTLYPLHQAFGVTKVFATSMQAVSGAGYPGYPFIDIHDNVIPFINGEEEKIEIETRLLLGSIINGNRIPAEFALSAQTNRVPVSHGHTICLSVGFKNKPSINDAVRVLNEYRGPLHHFEMPSAPEQPVIVRTEKDRPQPRRDRDTNNGMSTIVGRIRPCSVLDLKMVTVVHNTIRGAAGGAILNAELLVSKGYIS